MICQSKVLQHCTGKEETTNVLNKTELGFKPDVALYISENLTPFNQRLAWQCR